MESNLTRFDFFGEAGLSGISARVSSTSAEASSGSNWMMSCNLVPGLRERRAASLNCSTFLLLHTTTEMPESRTIKSTES